MLKSISSQIFAAFLFFTIMMGGLGAYGIQQISRVGGIVTNLYDKPLMAISLARLASFTFSEMNNELLRRQLAVKAADNGDTRLDDLTKDLFDNLRLARERSVSSRPAALIDEIRALATRWDSLRRGTDLSDPAAAAAMDKLSTQILDKLDTMTELNTDEGFIQRETAVRKIGASSAVVVGATVAAMIFSIMITFLLTRRLLKPLSAAAAVANRVAGGDFQTAIPKGGADETGMLLASMAAMQANIREMMEREAAQRRSAQTRLVDAIEGSREGMMLIDADGKIAIANSQMAKFFPSIASLLVPGVSLVNALVDAAEQPESAARRQEWMTLFFSGEEIVLGNGRWLRISQSTTQEGGRFLFLSDITALKEREESLTGARQAAEAASIAKTNFLANMGHELRTPLNAVIGFSEIIAGEQFGPIGTSQYLEYAWDIAASGRHLLAIINDVLDLAKSIDGKLRMELDAVDLNNILADCARINDERCETAGLELAIDIEPVPAMVRGDAAKLRQICLNLLSNAIKFTPAGGQITLATRRLGEGTVELQVADTGIGMRAEDISVALEPFGQIDNTLTRRYEGVGLGLPLTEALVDLHSGRMEIESTLDDGTTVRVLLPALA